MKLFVIVDNTLEPIGIFDNIDIAIENGKVATNNTFMVFAFPLNGKVSYCNDILYQSSNLSNMK